MKATTYAGQVLRLCCGPAIRGDAEGPGTAIWVAQMTVSANRKLPW